MSQIQYVRKISLSKTFHKDQLIYNSSEDNFFPEYKKVIIFNRQFGNKSKLIAKLESLNGSIIEKNSDDIVKIIGEKNFETLFLALCSVINQEFRIKGIMSILNTVKTNGTDTTNESQDNGKSKVDVQCQTDEIRISTSDVKKRRIRKHLAPYALPSLNPPEPKIRRLVINIPNNETIPQTDLNNERNKPNNNNGLTDLQDLDFLHDDNSNGTVSSKISYTTTDTLMNDPLSILNMVDSHTLSVSETNTLMENLEQANLFKKTEAGSLNPLSDSSNDNSAITITEVSSLNITTELSSSIKADGNPLTEPEATLTEPEAILKEHKPTLRESEPTLNKTEVNSLSKTKVTLEKTEESLFKSMGIPLNDSEIGIMENIPFHNFVLTFPDRTTISIALPTKPEDPFHIVTTENMKYITRPKLIELQMKIDEKLCYHPADDDGCLPIHVATLNNDLELLRRQCFILNKKKETVDILANDMTALKLSLSQPTVAATVILLQFNADPLYLDDNHSSYFHLAAELNTDHLSVLLHYCRMNARQIILENEEIQLPGWRLKSDKELSEYLLNHICTMCDNQGYTPLMLASNLGLNQNVKLLLEASKSSVNKQMPNTGNTALYLAVASCCNMASGHFAKYRPAGRWTLKIGEKMKSTIETLLHYGADPTIDNYVGSNVTLLLTEFPLVDLITLISNNTKIKIFKSTLFDGDFQNLMLVKENEKIEVKNINSKPIKKNEVIPTLNFSEDIKTLNGLNEKSTLKLTSDPFIKQNTLLLTSNTLNTQNEIRPTLSSLNFRKIAPKQTLNSAKPEKISILKNIVIQSPQTTPGSTITVSNIESSETISKIESPLSSSNIESPKTISNFESSKTISNIESPNSNNSIQGWTEIMKPIYIKKDNKIVLLSGKSTKTDSIVATQSSNLIQKPTILIQKSPNLIQKSPNLLQKPTILVQKPTNLAQKPTNLAQKPTNLIQKPTSLIQKPTNLLQKSTNLIEKPTDLIQKSTDLIQKSTNLAQKPTNLLHKSTNLIKKPTDLIQKSTNLIQKSPNLVQKLPNLLKKSTSLIQKPTSNKKVVFRRSIQKIDLVKEAKKVINSIYIERQIDEEIPSTSNKLNN